MSDAKAIIGAEIIPNNHSDILERARLVQRVNAHWSDSICDCEECAAERCALLTPMADEIESLRSRLADAEREARVLVVAMADECAAPDNWKPLPDAAGMITQISNMVAGLREERALIVQRAENAEAALVEAEQEYQDARTVRKQLEARLADTEQQRDDALALLTKISLRKSCEGTQPYICHGLATARSWLAAADALLKEARDEINHLSGYAEDETDGKSGLTTWPLLDRIDAHLAREPK